MIGSFDLATAREVAGTARTQALEAKARLDASAGTFLPPVAWALGGSYWSSVQHSLEIVIYAQQYKKRIERNQRKSQV